MPDIWGDCIYLGNNWGMPMILAKIKNCVIATTLAIGWVSGASAATVTDQQLVLVGSSGFIFDAEIGSSNGDAGSFAVGFSASQPMAGEVSLLFFGFDRAQFVGFNMGWSSGEALTISNTSTYPGPFTISTVFGPTTLNQTLLFTWDDGTETDVDFNIEGQISAVPLPAALPMLAAGFGFLGIVGARRKKRKS